MTMHDDEPVCRECGSPEITPPDHRGHVLCLDCGEHAPPAEFGNWLSGQECPHMIPDEYAEP